MNGFGEIGTSESKSRELTILRLYIAGQTPQSLLAVKNLKNLCEAHLCGKYRIEIVDLLKDPHWAQGDKILVLPTLVRLFPTPIRKIIGDLSNTERALAGLGLRQQEAA